MNMEDYYKMLREAAARNAAQKAAHSADNDDPVVDDENPAAIDPTATGRR